MTGRFDMATKIKAAGVSKRHFRAPYNGTRRTFSLPEDIARIVAARAKRDRISFSSELRYLLKRGLASEGVILP